MRILLRVVVCLLACTSLARAQQSSPPVLPSNLYTTLPSGSGSGSPSSLATFFNKYYGLAPQDYGAKGDTHVYFNCGMTTNNHVTCGSAHFAATDVGKWFESCASGCTAAGPTINKGTIAAFNSATDVTVSVSAGTTYNNTKLAFGTDDDAAIQSWITALIAASSLGVTTLTRGAYVPQGGYAIKQPMLFTYAACNTQGSCTEGEGGPNTGQTGTLRPSLWITGQGTASTFFYVRTAGTFTWPTTSNNTAALYVKNFDFSSLANFGVIGDLTAHTTSTVTGVVAGVMNDNSTHAVWSSLWIQGFHNTTNNLCGFATSMNDFESSYSYSAIEASDFNGCLGQSTVNGTYTMEKIKFDTDFWENPLQGQNIRIGNGGTINLNLKQLQFVDNHSLGTSMTASINILSATNTVNGDTIELFGFRQQNVSGNTTNLGFVTNTPDVLNIDCHGCYFEDTATSAASLSIDNTSASSTINLYGGGLFCTNCTNHFNNAGNIFVYGTKVGGNPTVATIQTGAGFTYSFVPHAGAGGGFDGNGYVQMSKVVSVTNCSVNSVSPAACGASSAGAFVVPTTTTTYTVNSTSVSAVSRIHLQPITFAADLPSAPTCVSPATGAVTISAITAGTSFTFALPSTAGQTCWYYTVEN